MRFRLPQLGNHVGVQQELFHARFTGLRLRRARRAGTRSSKRGPGPSSNALRPGREDFCKRRHSSIGTSTAAAMPRRVTTWGPFLSAVSSISLKRAFASCTCHCAKLHLLWSSYITSQKTSQVWPQETIGATCENLCRPDGAQIVFRFTQHSACGSVLGYYYAARRGWCPGTSFHGRKQNAVPTQSLKPRRYRGLDGGLKTGST